jgi:uncharacterized protein YktA (UPF0223 family)
MCLTIGRFWKWRSSVQISRFSPIDDDVQSWNSDELGRTIQRVVNQEHSMTKTIDDVQVEEAYELFRRVYRRLMQREAALRQVFDASNLSADYNAWEDLQDARLGVEDAVDELADRLTAGRGAR